MVFTLETFLRREEMGAFEMGFSTTDAAADRIPAERSLLIADGDAAYGQRLARALEGRGFTPRIVENAAQALAQIEAEPPAFAVVDLKLRDGHGVDLVAALKKRRPDARPIVVTAYGNIATAV